ncbi:hypothetical protein GCM10022254_23000 [Actinomadura meridiana]|uniref:Uncharacterized protein n=1 Tax=Actinomadura meridiana TaxID=559626 RepID=A0ABP8BXN4_9ACTN
MREPGAQAAGTGVRERSRARGRPPAPTGTDRCQGPQRGCTQLPTLEVVLGRLADRSTQEPLRVCSQCAACLLTVHGVWPEGAPSPFRVVVMTLLQQPVANRRTGPHREAREDVPPHETAPYPSRPRRAPEGARPA